MRFKRPPSTTARSLVAAILLVILLAGTSGAGMLSGTTVLAQQLLPLPPQSLEVAFPKLSFARMTHLTHAGDGTDRLWVLSQVGQIMVFPNNPQASSSTVFLDIQSEVTLGDLEEGLLGLAFDPNYAKNGFFYIYYSATNPRRSVISRFSVSATDPNLADPSSELILLEIPRPFGNHSAGTMTFAADGYLYIALGDGGNDTPVADPLGHGQNTATLLGSILRIDVAGATAQQPYRIPPDNPLVGVAGAKGEIWAYGLRNPWKISFDPATGSLWAADVGQKALEEIDIIQRGGNYGWSIMEGTSCYPPTTQTCSQTGLIPPIFEYGRADGCAIIGGHVYRGRQLPDLVGVYLYSDWCSGRIWGLRHDGTKLTHQALLVNSAVQVQAIGRDQQGELYFLGLDKRIYKFIGPGGPTNQTTATTPANFKVAFIGDQGNNSDGAAVLQLIKNEGAHMVLHQGDFDYVDNPNAWDQQITSILGADFPYFASIGNHDVGAWSGYQQKLRDRLAKVSGATCIGDLGVKAACTYKGLSFVLSGVGTRGSDHELFIRDALRSHNSVWKLCSWHKVQRLMQTGIFKQDETGWGVYEECRLGGAIIATAHEHSYSRTHLMSNFQAQTIASTSNTLQLEKGKTFAFVSGIGGVEIRGQDPVLAANPWWASVYNAAQGAKFGALFCVFAENGVVTKAHCYFKNIAGAIIDQFDVVAQASDLSVTIRDSLDKVPQESRWSYTIATNNAGSSTATGVTLTHVLPPLTNIFSIQPSQGTCSTTNKLVTCLLGSVAPGSNTTVAVHVSMPFPGTFTASTSVKNDVPDPDLSNNTLEQTTIILPVPTPTPFPPVIVVPAAQVTPVPSQGGAVVVVDPTAPATVRLTDSGVLVDLPPFVFGTTFQLRLRDSAGETAPPGLPGSPLRSFQVELFQANAKPLESASLWNPATIRVVLTEREVEASGGLGYIFNNFVGGRIRFFRHRPGPEEQAWEPLPTNFDLAQRTFSTTVSSFSTFSLAWGQGAPAWITAPAPSPTATPTLTPTPTPTLAPTPTSTPLAPRTGDVRLLSNAVQAIALLGALLALAGGLLLAARTNRRAR